MLNRSPLMLSAARRTAFTLMEVLVVVAIVVVLASVGTIGVLKFLKDAKEDKAMQQMMNLATVEKAWSLKNSGNQLQNDLTPLMDLLDQGQSALTDPWGNQYQVEYVQTQTQTGVVNMRAVFHTMNTDTMRRIEFPNMSKGQ